jgi:hypothetical protein
MDSVLEETLEVALAVVARAGTRIAVAVKTAVMWRDMVLLSI